MSVRHTLLCTGSQLGCHLKMADFSSILSNSAAKANWPLEKARKRNGGHFPGRHVFEQTCLLWLRNRRTKALPLRVLPRGLLDERSSLKLQSAPVGLLTGAVPVSPQHCHAMLQVRPHGLPKPLLARSQPQPSLAKELTSEKPLSSLTRSCSGNIAAFWGIWSVSQLCECFGTSICQGQKDWIPYISSSDGPVCF